MVKVPYVDCIEPTLELCIKEKTVFLEMQRNSALTEKERVVSIQLIRVVPPSLSVPLG